MSAVPMGSHAPAHDVSDTPTFLKWGPGMGAVGLIGALISIICMFAPATQAFMLNSWVLGFMFWVLISLGCLGLTLLYHSIRGGWISGILRLTEAGSSAQMFVIFFVMLIPVFLGMPHVYEWAGHAATDPLILKKAAYLNVPGFIGRSFIFLMFWAGLAHFLRRSSLRSDSDNSPVEAQWRSNYATPALVAFVTTLTFATTDWGMSLTPHWTSTIYGVWLMVGGVLGALSLCTLLLCTNAKRFPFNTMVAPNFTKDLGNMTFAFTMLWAYTSVSQLIIIWNGNLPEFASYYARRSSDGWNAIGMLTIIGQFVVPFLVLNSPRVKRYPDRLARIMGWIFVVHIADVFQIIGRALPAHPSMIPGKPELAMPNSYDLLAFVTIGAIWFWSFCAVAKKAPLLPRYDRRLEEEKLHAH